jgi:hypothetical protein
MVNHLRCSLGIIIHEFFVLKLLFTPQEQKHKAQSKGFWKGVLGFFGRPWWFVVVVVIWMP